MYIMTEQDFNGKLVTYIHPISNNVVEDLVISITDNGDLILDRCQAQSIKHLKISKSQIITYRNKR